MTEARERDALAGPSPPRDLAALEEYAEGAKSHFFVFLSLSHYNIKASEGPRGPGGICRGCELINRVSLSSYILPYPHPPIVHILAVCRVAFLRSQIDHPTTDFAIFSRHGLLPALCGFGGCGRSLHAGRPRRFAPRQGE